MNLGVAILTAGFALVLFFALFRPLETAFPVRVQAVLRPHWLTDLGFFLGQYLFLNGAVLTLLDHVRGLILVSLPSDYLFNIAIQPFWLQAATAIFASDLSIYWAHRLQHRVDFLWRFHEIHHTAEHLDWLAAHREHPVDTLYSVLAMNVPLFLLGFPLESIAGLLAFRGLWAIFIHSNVKLPIGRLELLIGSPRLHHWHHAKERDVGNYANLSPLMDLIFGTHHAPDSSPAEYGVQGEVRQSYLALLLRPFNRR